MNKIKIIKTNKDYQEAIEALEKLNNKVKKSDIDNIIIDLLNDLIKKYEIENIKNKVDIHD